MEFTEALINWGVGSLGILIFALWKLRKYLSSFDPRKFFIENARYWAWGILMIGAFSLLLFLVPDAGQSIKSLTGLDLESTRVSYVTMGTVLGGMSNELIAEGLKDKKKSPVD